MVSARYAEDQSSIPFSPFIILNRYVKKAKLKKKYPFLNDKGLLYRRVKDRVIVSGKQNTDLGMINLSFG